MGHLTEMITLACFRASGEAFRSGRGLVMKLAVLSVWVGLASLAVVSEQKAVGSCSNQGWELGVDVLWKFCVLDETSNDITKEDFSGFIIVMDDDGNDEDYEDYNGTEEENLDAILVDPDEFRRWWRCTMMHDEDIDAVFFMMSSAADHDNSTITVRDTEQFWDTFSNGLFSLNKQVFTQMWKDHVLNNLRNHGCQNTHPVRASEEEYQLETRFCKQMLEGAF